ncbi:MAG: DUF1559 domain-containing protein [Isosphaerales bacterium]
MAIVLRCECGNEFQTRDENAGRPVRCPVCQRELFIPQPKLPPDGEFAEFDDDRPSRTSGKAIASLILGLCSFVACCVGVPVTILVAGCIGVPAIILGMLGLSDINNPKKRVMGKGMAMTGTVLGTLTTIVLVLFALTIESREPPRRAQCANNQKQIAMAMHNFHDQHGTFPPAAKYDANGKPLLSWRVLILPYLEQQGLYEQFHLDEPWDSPHNKPLADRMPPDFRCPSEPLLSQSLTTYEVIVDPRSMFTGEPTGVPMSSVSDGSSTTLLVVEAASPVPWSKPEDRSLASLDRLLGMGSKHPGGFNAAMADGSVRFVRTAGNDAISPQDLRALVTRDGHEAVAAP